MSAETQKTAGERAAESWEKQGWNAEVCANSDQASARVKELKRSKNFSTVQAKPVSGSAEVVVIYR